MAEETTVKYDGHRENNDGSKRVAFRLPNREAKWRVTMPASYPKNCVLDWIKDEGIEEFLTEKYYSDKQYDKDNNILRRKGVMLHHFTFYFNSFDGDIEIYRAIYGGDSYGWGMIDNIKDLFDFYNEKTINQIKSKIEESYNINVKSVMLVKEDLSGGSINFGDINEYKRDNKLNDILNV